MEISPKDIESLSATELNSLMYKIKSALAQKRENEYAKAREQVDEIAKSVGLSTSDLIEITEKPAPKPQKEDYYP